MDRLANTVRPYAWGSTTAIPALLGTPPTGAPQAELWMGAHPGAPSRLDRGTGPVSLADLIEADPEGELGEAALRRFGPRLPFLLKVLAAGSPLSLQVHPDREQARQGFEDEEERGVPIDAPHRNYKDTNHKPELICALEPFDGLCGFRPTREAAELIEALGVDALKPLVDLLRALPEAEALRDALTTVLTTEQGRVAETVEPAAAAAERLACVPGPFASDYAAYASIARAHPGDPGVIAAMLLNHVRLSPGEALYLGAGVPHAYLSGMGVEIMANSDNVLRCGLTQKHVDVKELLKVVVFRGSGPGVLRPEPGEDGEQVYPTPIDEFRLSRYVLDGVGPRKVAAGVPQILLCTDGSATVRERGAAVGEAADGGCDLGSRGGELVLARGESAFVPAGTGVEIDGEGTVFRATVVV
ncbi:mannose-6-phosphate isomerase, class I [Wenjunlia tyrosinilytica]|uniref:mannose-6-phosphate isomerase n=1 Tax=Wenjunlia tyrosinilytica TaxID=1544741 RepID=A0A917ZQH2_9ACTN|nr:mannose-6-phosphate isomerase, class I [Wenjunlia tyrosinilytica]GGO88059.1 mannose-6-phosphate isomerase, class I [Wenjunlia tyrosinilytica]